jgi:hypothetical protein
MKVDLNQNEIRIINEALDAWEKECAQEAMSSLLLGAIFRPEGQSKEEERKEASAQAEFARKQTSARRNQSIMLRAKLITADALESEHTVKEEA